MMAVGPVGRDGAVAEAVSPPQERTRIVKKARNSPCNPVLSRAVFGQP